MESHLLWNPNVLEEYPNTHHNIYYPSMHIETCRRVNGEVCTELPSTHGRTEYTQNKMTINVQLSETLLNQTRM